MIIRYVFALIFIFEISAQFLISCHSHQSVNSTLLEWFLSVNVTAFLECLRLTTMKRFLRIFIDLIQKKAEMSFVTSTMRWFHSIDNDLLMQFTQSERFFDLATFQRQHHWSQKKASLKLMHFRNWYNKWWVMWAHLCFLTKSFLLIHTSKKTSTSYEIQYQNDLNNFKLTVEN